MGRGWTHGKGRRNGTWSSKELERRENEEQLNRKRERKRNKNITLDVSDF
jgi:hypothetical protein